MSSSTEVPSRSVESVPLDGLRVLDFTQIGAGPLCGMYLGDLGADVIKIEPPTGDLGRALGLPWVDEESPINVSFNRNKRSLCVDLKSLEGRRIALKLVAKADVLLESFRPGVMARFGLDYESVCRINERLVYCSVSAYGQSGPMANQAGVDGIVQGTSGLMSLIGSEGAEPCKVQAPVVDVSTGFIATIGTLAQLLERTRTGRGGYLDVNLFASAVALQQSAITTYLGNGELPKRLGSAAPYAAPNEAFETANGWIMIAAYNGDRWNQLCKVLGLEDIAADPRLFTLNQRLLNRDLMKQCLGPRIKKETSEYWLDKLEPADILCGKVATYEDLAANPQVEHMKLLTHITGGSGRRFATPSFPVNSRVPRPARGAPACGEHTREILASLGLRQQEVEELRTKKAVFFRTNTQPTRVTESGGVL